MYRTKTYKLSVKERIQDYGLLIKFKLSLTVVFSAVLAYLIIGGASATMLGGVLLFVGGMLVTGAANALNQVLEKDYDALMERTKNRPVVTGRMSASEAVLSAGLMSLVGITILGMFNPLTAFLGMLSLVMYAFLYTPLKRFSSVSILVGTMPGALPVLIGATAVQGYISEFALVLFIIQVVWQLPHFLAIAYVGFDDYQKAGYKMLPMKGKSLDPAIGLYALLSALTLIVLAFLPMLSGDVGLVMCLIVAFAGVAYSIFAYKFYKNSSRGTALKLMFSSFAYLPIVLIAYYIGSII